MIIFKSILRSDLLRICDVMKSQVKEQETKRAGRMGSVHSDTKEKSTRLRGAFSKITRRERESALTYSAECARCNSSSVGRLQASIAEGFGKPLGKG